VDPPPPSPPIKQVSQHPKCRIRVTILERRKDSGSGADGEGSKGGSGSGGGGSEGSSSGSGGHKVQLSAVMVSFLPVIDSRVAGAAAGMHAGS